MKSVLLILHVLSALSQLLFFGVLGQKMRQVLIQCWAKRLLKILKIKIVVHGRRHLLNSKTGFLMVSNHVSWLDIHVINSVMPMTFVAKSDVANWPIFGWIAKNIGTIFIKREKISDLKRVIHLMQSRLSTGEAICIFPEGTSSDGISVLDFRSNLFESVAQTQQKILPIAIQYQEHNRYSNRAAFIGEMGLIDSIKQIMQSDYLEAHIHLLEPLESHFSRQNLAERSRQAILATKLFDDYNQD
jgi:1-acyl-sn-glycerol-3-phosphate acyltransferase